MNTKKPCSLDPLPTGVLQKCFQCFSQLKVPASLKEAVVYHQDYPKKQSIDPHVLMDC